MFFMYFDAFQQVVWYIIWLYKHEKMLAYILQFHPEDVLWPQITYLKILER